MPTRNTAATKAERSPLRMPRRSARGKGRAPADYASARLTRDARGIVSRPEPYSLADYAQPMKIASIRTTPVLAPIPRPLETASGTIDQFPLVLIDVLTDDGIQGRAYAQVYLRELLPALDRTVAGLAALITGRPLVPRDLHGFLLRRLRLFGVKN